MPNLIIISNENFKIYAEMLVVQQNKQSLIQILQTHTHYQSPCEPDWLPINWTLDHMAMYLSNHIELMHLPRFQISPPSLDCWLFDLPCQFDEDHISDRQIQILFY